MSKIAIISQPDERLLIDVAGCESSQEATQHLSWTLQTSSQFWQGLNIDLNFGALALSGQEVAQIISLANDSGVAFNQFFATNGATLSELQALHVKVGTGEALTVSQTMVSEDLPAVEEEKEVAEKFPQIMAGPGCELSGTEYGARKALNAQSVLFLKQTLRSGQTVSHKGHLVIVGDVNPGAEVMAEGDITVWGALRGIAHAGLHGNTDAQIRALKLRPMQLRIAHAIARAPDRPNNTQAGFAGPETARVVNGQIRIAPTITD
jgi:septum site-determining protein MinC